MQWSDGQPYTTDDVKFWYDTVLTDKRIAFVGQDHWKIGRPAGQARDRRCADLQGDASQGRTASSRCRSPGPTTTRRRAARSTTWSSSTSTTIRRPTRSRSSAASTTGSPRSRAPRGFQDDNTFFLNSSKKPTPERLDVHHRPRREHRARHRGAQSVLLEGRHRRATSCPTSNASSTSWSPTPQVLLLKTHAGRDRHDGPVHRHAQQQVGAVRRQARRAATASTR